jgi:hypothetical protein
MNLSQKSLNSGLSIFFKDSLVEASEEKNHACKYQCFGSGSALDPYSIGFLDPDPGGVKSANIEGKNDAKRQIIHHKKLF